MAALLIVGLPILLNSSFWIYNVTLISTYAVVVIGLNVLVGYIGIVSFAQTAFMAVGGYGVAILTVNDHWNPWLASVVAIALAGVLAFILGFPLLRLRGHYLTMATFALAIAVYYFVTGAGFTGGAVGISAVPVLAVGSISFGNAVPMELLTAGVAIVALYLVSKLASSHIGRDWKAIAAREDVAVSLGVRVVNRKLMAFTLAAVLGAIGGVLYVEATSYVSPDLYSTTIIVNLFVMLFIGGRARTTGPVIGTAIVLVLPELISSLSGVEGIVFDALLILIILFFPRGVVGGLASLWNLLLARSRRHEIQPVPQVEGSEVISG
ncbi:branched-chain amino acid ABC transporter permease [Ferrimicrobium sp.]|uniref:branched-chain amino acid ABC transporter permease n=1 Tax=Ferrimicrobium sp. TaxID=2926050 RepID=UPI00262AC4D1|nr:branched-chain amino acid ABC transporter permease [Ferrimicrobium sp.]